MSDRTAARIADQVGVCDRTPDHLSASRDQAWSKDSVPAVRRTSTDPVIDHIFGAPTIIGTDGKTYLQGHVSNVPEVTTGVQNWDSLRQLGHGMVDDTLNYLSQPEAVNKSILEIGPMLDLSVDYYSEKIRNADGTGFASDVQDFAGALAHGLAESAEKMSYPQDQRTVGKDVAAAMPFFICGKTLISGENAEALKLSSLSEQELRAQNIKRLDLPKFRFESDSFSLKGTVDGEPLALTRILPETNGVTEVTDFFKGDMPKGSGSIFLAKTLEAHGAVPSKQLVLSGIINPETIEAYQAGIPASESLLGKSTTKALQYLRSRV